MGQDGYRFIIRNRRAERTRETIHDGRQKLGKDFINVVPPPIRAAGGSDEVTEERRNATRSPAAPRRRMKRGDEGREVGPGWCGCRERGPTSRRGATEWRRSGVGCGWAGWGV